MPNGDPLAALLGQLSGQMEMFSKNFFSMGENMMRGLSGGLNGAMQFAPHNVLGGLMQGAGYFNATTSTSELQRRNIF